MRAETRSQASEFTFAIPVMTLLAWRGKSDIPWGWVGGNDCVQDICACSHHCTTAHNWLQTLTAALCILAHMWV